MIYRLTIYEADDTTVWLAVSTDIADTNPWLRLPESWAETEVDFASGSASIGEIVLEVIDPQTGGTQAQRGFTAKLADTSGRSALSGRRALLEDSVDGSTFRTIFDGVINRVELLESLSSFAISIRDIRERERQVELFRFTESPTVLPQGVLNGYGIPYDGAPESEWLVPPTQPLVGIFRPTSLINNAGEVDLFDSYLLSSTRDGVPIVRQEIVMSDAAIDAASLDGGRPKIEILWRAKGSTGAYTVTETAPIPLPLATRFIETTAARVGSDTGREVAAARKVFFPDGFGLTNTNPAPDQEIEFIVRYIGETSKDWPFHIEGVTVGELIKDIYDGVYSEFDPRMRYDSTSILALTTPIRMRVTEPVEDMRDWVERNLYVAAGAAPVIIDGLVHAVRYELPDVTVDVTELGNAEADVMPGWAQAVDDAVNFVEVIYQRDVSLAPDDPGYEAAAGDRIVSRDVVETSVLTQPLVESIALLGERRREFKIEALRAIGGAQGEPYSGDVADETGAQVARRIATMMTDRFALGGQTLVVMADRSIPDVEALQVGDWAVVTTTWTPDYQTGTRGGNRLGQIIARRDMSPIRTELVIIDAGPDAQPLNMPTLGTITQDAQGRVVVPIASVPTGAVARVDYAISSTQPAASSPLWTFAGRAGATASVTTPQLPSGRRVWIRARSEAVARRPSGYTNPVSIDIDATPRLRKVFAYDTADGIEIHWIGNTATSGVRIEYVEHAFGANPDYSAGLTVDTGTSPELLTDAFLRLPNAVLSFRVTPYPTFSGGSVSGTPGTPLDGSIFVGTVTEVPFGYVIAFRNGEDLEFAAQGNQLAAGGKWAVKVGEPPATPDDPLAELTGEFAGPFTFEQLTLYADPGYDDVWVGVWFYDDYDYAPTGTEGPRVLARATVLQTPLAGTLQPDLNVRIEYDEDSNDPIARVIATVTDPFARARAVDPMLAYVDTGPIDAVPELGDPLYVAQPIETTGPYAGSYVWEVPLTEKHLSVAALAFYWLDADSTERVISQILWLDVGDDANIVFVTVSYDDRTATVTVKGDADTDELYAEESDDGDPDGTWYAVDTPTPAFTGNRFATERRGTFSVQTRTDRERFFRVQGRNPDGRFGDFEYFQVDRFQDVVLGEPDVTLVDAEVGIFGVGTGATFNDRQVLLNVEVSEDVESIKVIWGPVTTPTGTPIQGDNTFDITPGTRRILSWYVGAEPTDPDNAVHFPLDYEVDTTVQIQGFSDPGGTTGFLQEARYRFGPNTGLPALRAVKGTTTIQSDALLVGSGIGLTSGTGGRPEVAIDVTTLPTVPVTSGGTGLDTLTSGAVIIGAGIDPPTFISPGDNGNVLTVSGGAWVSGGITGAVTNVTAGEGLSGGGTGSVTLDVVGYQGLVANRGKTALEITSGTQKALAVVLGTESDEAAPGNHSITSHPETGLTAGHVLRATSATAYSFGAIPTHTHTLANIQDAGDGTGAGRLVVGTSSGANTIPAPSAAGQVLKAVTTGTSATYEWGTVTTGVTSISAGNGLGGGGTGSVTLDVNPYVGFASGYGQTEIVSDSVAVVLGTDSANKAAPGIHGHTINAITDATTVGQNLVKLGNPSAIRFLRINANNTVSALTDSEMRTAIGAGTGNGTVTSVGGTGNVSGITLSGTVTSSGNLTLGGTLSVNLGTNVTGTLPIANGGTNATTAAQARTNLGAGTVTSVGSGTGLTGGPITGSGTLSLTGQALNLFNQTTTGFFVRTSTGSIVARSIAVTGSNAITISNGDGSAGNPTLQMSTPGTLTKTSTNSNTTAHTHALDGSIADVTVTGSAPTGTPSRAGSLHFVV